MEPFFELGCGVLRENLSFLDRHKSNMILTHHHVKLFHLYKLLTMSCSYHLAKSCIQSAAMPLMDPSTEEHKLLTCRDAWWLFRPHWIWRVDELEGGQCICGRLSRHDHRIIAKQGWRHPRRTSSPAPWSKQDGPHLNQLSQKFTLLAVADEDSCNFCTVRMCTTAVLEHHMIQSQCFLWTCRPRMQPGSGLQNICMSQMPFRELCEEFALIHQSYPGAELSCYHWMKLFNTILYVPYQRWWA